MRQKLWGKIIWLVTAIFFAGLVFPVHTLAQSTVDLVIHYVEGTPAKDKIAYDVNVYLSVVDSAGNPVKDLSAENFTVAEDSQQVEIDSVELATDEPINLVLLLDTSGSMHGAGIDAARTAASNFIAGLDSNDRVAVLSFDDTVNTVIDFTTDHKAARDQIALLDAKSGAGTCLYDAAYQAVQMSASLPAGRRAVILLTDGVDETPSGAICSAHTLDDVISLASSGGTRVPVYTLGLGNRIDEKTLERFASLTGGRYLYSPDSSQLDAMFLRLADHLRSQYLLKYTSVAGPGAHTLAVSVTYLNVRDDDTRNFLLPAMPTRVTINALEDGQEISGSQKISVSVSGGGEPIERVVFKVNDEVIGSDTTTPYEQDVDFNAYGPGAVNVSVVVYGAEDVELASDTVSVNVVEGANAEGTPIPGKSGTDNTSMPPSINWTLWGSIAGALLAVIAIVIFLLLKRRREERARDEAWEKSQSAEPEFPVFEDSTIDNWEPSPEALGMLVVVSSDDPTLINQRYEISKDVTRLGRKADNDIPFPKDSPVSRYHAVIEARGGGLFLSEVERTTEDGRLKRPTYGTYVNDRPLEGDPVLLRSGDEIRLGKRVRLKFEAAGALALGEDATYDGLELGDDDEKTREVDEENTVDFNNQ